MSENELEPFQDSGAHRITTSATGARGEALAAETLESMGFRLVLLNFSIPVGRDIRGGLVRGEIDIIAIDGPTLCFVEVKTRTSDEFAGPLTNVDLRKQRAVTRTAHAYRRAFGVRSMPYRFDVVTVIERGVHPPEIALFKNFWEPSKFRKRSFEVDHYS